MEYYDEDEQQIGKREGVDAMIDTESVSDVGPRNPTGGWTTEDQGAADTTAHGTRAWQDMAQRQALQAEQQRMDAFQQKLDGYAQLEGAAKLQTAAINQDRGTALLAMMDSIRKNGGTMSPALNQAMSASFGFPVTGALLVNSGKQAGTLIIGTPQKGADGQVHNGVGMLISPEQRYQIFKNLNGGQYTEPYMAADFAAIKKSSGLTDDQLASKGFTNPMGVQTVGTTNISGSLTNRLLGRAQPRSSISAVGFDGKGGRTNYVSNAGTGYQLESYDSGTRSDDFKGRWKQIGSGPSDTFNGKDDKTQTRIFENSKTGEVVRVKDGERMPWENDLKALDIAKGGRRTAADSMAEVKAREAGKDDRSKQRADIERMKMRVKSLQDSVKNDDAVINNVESSEADKKAARDHKAKVQAQIDALNGIVAEDGANAAPQTTAGGATLNGASAWGDANKREGGTAGTNSTMPNASTSAKANPVKNTMVEERMSVEEIKKLPESEQMKWRYRTDKAGKLVGYRYKSVEKPQETDSSGTNEENAEQEEIVEKSDETKLKNKPNGASNKSNVKPSDGSIAEKQTISPANGNPYKKNVEDNAPAKKIVDWFANKVKSGQRKNWAYEHMTSEEQNAFPGMSDSDKEALVEKVYDEYAKGKRK